MSLGIVIKGPEGIVLAADSRLTLTAQTPQGPIHVNYDNATKLLSFNKPHNYVSVVTYGQAAIGLRTASSYLPEFENTLKEERLPVKAFAERLSTFFLEQWRKEMPGDYKGPNMTFVVGGFSEGDAYGQVFLFEIPGSPEPRRQYDSGFGITWGGQREIVDRLMQGFDGRIIQILTQKLNLQEEDTQKLHNLLKQELQLPVPIQAMALQDCVDLSVFFLRTTMWAQNLTIGIRGVGGAIDVATITRREGFRFIQKKEIVAERSNTNV